MIQRRKPLQRSRIPIRKVGVKRQAINREYSRLRKAFLTTHPVCEWYLAQNGLTMEGVAIRLLEDTALVGIPLPGIVDRYGWYNVPRSVDVHHKRGRGRYLLDVSTWMAVSREAHQFIHDHPKEARAKGYLLDR